MSMAPGRERLDELLNQSSPRTTPITTDVADEITRLQAATEASWGSAPRRRRWARPVVAGFAAVLLVGGVATAAAAATGLWTLPWAPNNAVASFSYTLPSGVRCEQRLGGVTGTIPNAIAAVEHFYRHADFDALLSTKAIDATIAHRRSGERIFVNPDGSTERSGFGTKHYSADEEYQDAVWDVVTTAMDADLARQGVGGIDTNLTFQGDLSCPGADG